MCGKFKLAPVFVLGPLFSFKIAERSLVVKRLSLFPISQNESSCETIHMKMSSTHDRFIFMQIKLIFI